MINNRSYIYWWGNCSNTKEMERVLQTGLSVSNKTLRNNIVDDDQGVL